MKSFALCWRKNSEYAERAPKARGTCVCSPWPRGLGGYEGAAGVSTAALARCIGARSSKLVSDAG